MATKLTREKQKELALENMRQLNIYSPYIKEFRENDVVTMFEEYGGFWATAENGEKALEQLIKQHEDETGDLVYAVTHELTEFGELYSMLVISSYAEDAKYCKIKNEGKDNFAFAYVYNVTCPDCSEFGDICVRSFGGGIKRVG